MIAMESKSSPPAPSNPETRDFKRRRASAACTVCHRRKVRCNASVTIPCSNCLQDGEECVMHVSGRGKHKRVKVNKPPVQEKVSSYGVSSGNLPYVSTHITPGIPEESYLRHQGRPSSPPRQTSAAAPGVSTIQEEENGGENVEAFKNIVDPPNSKGQLVPFYVGERQGLRFVFNVAKDSVIAHTAHFLVERPARDRLAPEDLQYLQAKGSFTLPPEELCKELLGLYFNFVHPLLPIVDPSSFLMQYEHGGSLNLSLLLLQSMLFAASSFVTPDLLAHFGVSSIKALKKQLYQRTKALYDIDYEIDKIPLIQAVLLMCYWYGNTHDRADSWHWTGVATSLCQSVGFHQNPGRNIPETQRRLWRRIWWCCAHRDSWISLGMGRPTRVNKDDCDVDMLSLQDLIDPNPSPSLSEWATSLIHQCNAHAPLFVELNKLSYILHDVLVYQFGAGVRRKSLDKIQLLETELQDWYAELDPWIKIDFSAREDHEDLTMILHKHMLHWYYQVAVITLHRPVIFQTFNPLHYPEGKSPSDAAFEKAVFAASLAIDSIRRLIDLDLSRRLPPESVTTLISTIATLFLEKFSAVGLKRQIAGQKLDFALMLVEELVDKYWAARFMHKYFKAALEKIESATRVNPDSSRTPSARNGEFSNVHPAMIRGDQTGQSFNTPTSDSTMLNPGYSPDMMLNDLGFIFEAADLFNMLE